MLRASRSIQTERLHRLYGFRDYARSDGREGLSLLRVPCHVARALSCSTGLVMLHGACHAARQSQHPGLLHQEVIDSATTRGMTKFRIKNKSYSGSFLGLKIQ